MIEAAFIARVEAANTDELIEILRSLHGIMGSELSSYARSGAAQPRARRRKAAGSRADG